MLMVIINTGLPVGTKGRNSLGFTLKQNYNQGINLQGESMTPLLQVETVKQ